MIKLTTLLVTLHEHGSSFIRRLALDLHFTFILRTLLAFTLYCTHYNVRSMTSCTVRHNCFFFFFFHTTMYGVISIWSNPEFDQDYLSSIYVLCTTLQQFQILCLVTLVLCSARHGQHVVPSLLVNLGLRGADIIRKSSTALLGNNALVPYRW